jgi:membrane protein YqaA with SNARE-associated domain
LDALLELLNADGVSLWAMFVVGFVAATVVPVSSEVLLVALVRAQPDRFAAILAVATIGNTLGGMTTYALGRWVAGRVPPEQTTSRWAGWLRRWGAPTLLLAWAPVFGDALCGLAGWMRVAWWQAMLWMALGKLARYWLLAAGAAML